ncbi:hypothetical protein DH2020_000845 [Rehmannia glutinosa]|uniref:BHLH domain-containing protein n=1 Tax=Rehmannia glutinosa TaxID=99300 RepID=A0ABR0XY52_REHGL
MAALETVVEWLRPLVNNKKQPWDYCLIWKLGDDPSRFIEWGACCCSGGNRPEDIKIKDENGLEKHLIDECKDEVFKHLVRSKGCKKLAQLPSAIPLYSGIHGDVVISKQPRWTVQSNPSALDDEPNGTQVLIPVASGLIELFSTEHKAEKGVFKSKNLMTERNRRKRIKDGMFALRALVPKISKMDRASTLGDAAEYIKELQETIDNYHDELRAMEKEEECNKVNAKPNLTKLNRDCSDKKGGAIEKTQPVEVQVEVSQLGTKGFLLKLICQQKRGGFSRLMEAIDSLGLKVTDANVTTLNGSVLNVLKVEANRTEVELNNLKRSLIQLVS